MMEPQEESPPVEVDCHTPDMFPSQVWMMEPGEASSPLEVDCYTRDTGPSPIVRCSVLRMGSLPPQVGREVRAHAHALMAIASDVVVVAHDGLA